MASVELTNSDLWLLPEGMEAILPTQAAAIELLRQQSLAKLKQWGYQLVIPPFAEFNEMDVGNARDVDLQSLKVSDAISGRMMTLRADITSYIARMDAHRQKTNGVTRFCYADTVLLATPKTYGGSRSPLQLGAELFGQPGVEADIEVICLMLEILQTAGLSSLCLDLGHMGIYRSLMSQAQLEGNLEQNFFAALQRKSFSDARQLLSQFNEEVTQTQTTSAILEVLNALLEQCGGIEVITEARKLLNQPQLSAVNQEALKALDRLEIIAERISQCYPQIKLYFDLLELRGYSYHGGIVFAVYTQGVGHPIANGGRCDGIGTAWGQSRALVGFNTDLKDLARCAQLNTSAEQPVVKAPVADNIELIEHIRELRAQGYRVICSVGENDESEDEQGFSYLLKRNTSGVWELVSVATC